MASDADERTSFSHPGRRAGVALTMALALVGFFAVLLQLTAEFVSWVTNTRVTFLFPNGLSYALIDTTHLVNVLVGLVMVSFGVAAILYWRMWLVERRAARWARLDRDGF